MIVIGLRSLNREVVCIINWVTAASKVWPKFCMKYGPKSFDQLVISPTAQST